MEKIREQVRFDDHFMRMEHLDIDVLADVTRALQIRQEYIRDYKQYEYQSNKESMKICLDYINELNEKIIYRLGLK